MKDVSKLGMSIPVEEGFSDKAKSSVVTEEDKKAFSKILAQKTSEEKKAETMSRKTKSKEASSREETKRTLEQKLKGPQGELSFLHQYLYNLLYKDPSTLDLATKQALHIEQDGKKVGIYEFQKLLVERNINLNQLSFSQIAELVKKNTKAELVSYLNQLSRDMKSSSPKAAIAEVSSSKEQSVFSSTSTSLAEMEKVSQGRIKEADIVQQIIRQLELRKVTQGSELVMKLNPEFLGQMRLKLIVNRDRVSAHFETTSRLVKEIVQRNMDDLEEALAKRGLKVFSTKVEMIEEMA